MRRVLLLAALVLLVSSPAQADRITAGAVTYVSGVGPISIALASDRFTFDGRASPFTGIFMPWIQCSVPECRPGTGVDLFAHWSGGDLSGTATLDGETFLRVGSLASTSSLFATWTGMLAIPAGFGSGVLTAPFEFSGLFFYERPFATPHVLDLFGRGTATATFQPYALYPGALRLESIRYDFENAAPTPEPASMLLIGTGLAGLFAARSRLTRRR